MTTTQSPDVCWGQTVFTGTRIPVDVIVGQLSAGVPLAELQADFPQLPQDAWDYALRMKTLRCRTEVAA